MRKIIFISLFLSACDSDPLAPSDTEEPMEDAPTSTVVATPVETPTEEESKSCDDKEPPPPVQNCYCSFLCLWPSGVAKLMDKFEAAEDETQACGLIPDHVECAVVECYCSCDPA